jgi:CRISPR-associated protein Cas5d
VRRNEVGKIASPRVSSIFIEDERQQRAGLFLRDVKYRLYAEFIFIPPDQRGKGFNPLPEFLIDNEEIKGLQQPDERKDETEAKYAAMFERRARKGQCFNQPYLGCREFSCHFKLINSTTKPASPIDDTRDLGWMLYDMDFRLPSDPKPQFFHAFIRNGVIDLNNVEVRS